MCGPEKGRFFLFVNSENLFQVPDQVDTTKSQDEDDILGCHSSPVRFDSPDQSTENNLLHETICGSKFNHSAKFSHNESQKPDCAFRYNNHPLCTFMKQFQVSGAIVNTSASTSHVDVSESWIDLMSSIRSMPYLYGKVGVVKLQDDFLLAADILGVAPSGAFALSSFHFMG